MKILTQSLILILIIGNGYLSAQSKSIRKRKAEQIDTNRITVHFTVFTDNELDTVKTFTLKTLGIKPNYLSKEVIKANYTSHLKYNSLYSFEFTGANLNTNHVEVDTKAPIRSWDLQLNIYLYSEEYTRNVLKDYWTAYEKSGKMAYNDSVGNFQKVLR